MPRPRAASASTSSTPRRPRSLSTATADDLVAGHLVGCFGIRGELKCDSSKAARVLFVPGARFRYALRDASGELRVSSVREHGGHLLLALEGVADRTAAQALVGAALYAPKESIPLGEGEYLDADLIGCAVVDASGTPFGKVERVEHFPASDMLVVDGKLVPMVDAIVTSIELDRRRITISPPQGLLD